MSDFVFSSETDEPDWRGPSELVCREADNLVGYAKQREVIIDPVIAKALVKLPLDGADFSPYLDWLEGAKRLIVLPEDTCNGMMAAARRLDQALKANETIAVFCDYDVDGTSSGAIFRKAMAGALLYIGYADAGDGFGVTNNFIQESQKVGASLLVTLDCGTGQKEEIALAQELGMEVIVVDHHHVEPDNPAEHHLNPKLNGTSENTGAQLTWKLMAALDMVQTGRTRPERWEEDLYLAGLGCLADMGSVALPENRVFMRAARHYVPAGIRAIAESLEEDPSLPGSLITTQACLNQPKRTTRVKAGDVGELLAQADLEQARVLATPLLEAYLEGREARENMLEAALIEIESEQFFSYAIIDDMPEWSGYAGPVAQAVSSKTKKPAIIFVKRLDGLYKFSGRNSASSHHLGELIDDSQMREGCLLPDGSLSLGGHQAVVSGTCTDPQLIIEACENWARSKTSFYKTPWDGPEAFPLERNLEPARFLDLAEQAQQLAPFGRGKQIVIPARRNRPDQLASHNEIQVSVRGLAQNLQEPNRGWAQAELCLADGSIVDICVPEDLELPIDEKEWIIRLGRRGPYYIRTFH